MTPDGNNYPIQEHSVLFWGAYLGGIMLFTILILGLFLLMVSRHSRATRPAGEQRVTPADAAERPQRELDRSTAA